jgi:hypothetical protein
MIAIRMIYSFPNGGPAFPVRITPTVMICLHCVPTNASGACHGTRRKRRVGASAP